MIIEEPVRFSASRIWRANTDFYDTAGIDAWSNNVPFLITNNPCIAESYANLIVRFIQDCIHSGRYHQEEPFYILELGAGSGALAFYILKQLSQLKRLLGLEHTSIVYVMTDVSQKSIDYWKNHLAFQPFLQEGLLDFALCDIERDREIVLQHTARTISASDASYPTNPMIAIANYVFDSLPQDIFRITNGETQLCMASVKSNHEVDDDESLQLSEVLIEFSYEAGVPPFFSNPRFSEAFEKCRARLADHYLLFPVGALRFIENLVELSANQLCLIVSDNGFAHTAEIRQKSEPDLVFLDDCFWMAVNFDALGRYFECIGGVALHHFPETDDDLQTSVFLAGFQRDQIPETQHTMDVFVNTRSHSMLFNLNEYLQNTKRAMPIEMLLPILAATRWDPIVFHNNLDTIIEQIRTQSAQVTVQPYVSSLVLAIGEIANNFYYVPGLPDVFADISVFLQEVGAYQQALEYYERSIALFGPVETTLCNMGLCHYYLGERARAIDCLQQAVAHNPKNVMARGWIAQIEYENQVESSSLEDDASSAGPLVN